MNKWIILLASGMILGQGTPGVFAAGDDHIHRIDEKTRKIICYYNTTPVDLYIPPPEAYLKKLKSGQENGGATFKFQLINAPSYFAEGAAQFAGDVWGSLIYSPVPINVRIEFMEYDEGEILAGAYPTATYRLDNNGYLPERLYPIALAEKFFQRNLNGTEPDIIIEVNKNVKWYYLTDGETPPSEFDFASIMIHELAHGLGFRGYFSVDNEENLGYGAIPPGAFDGFFENGQGQRLIDTILFPPRGSNELRLALITPPVYFVSPIIAREVSGENPGPKMHIPNPWAQGNSLYHLHSDYDGTKNALMTFSTSPGSPIHDPGPLTTYMLYENGWVHTYIVHDTLKDRESLEDPFTVSAEIFGDKGVKSGTQYLFYAFNGSQAFDSVDMTSTGIPDEFSADIPVGGLNTTVHYFIKTQDSYGRVYTMPANAPEMYYRFYVGTDVTPPTVKHDSISYILNTWDSVLVKAKISDNLGLDLTQVEYKINDVDQAPFDLEFDTLVNYSGYFVFSEGQLKAGDVIKYRIKATDASAAGNTTYNPESRYFEFSVFESPPFTDTYFTDFESGLDDFLPPNGFYHAKPDGFSSYAMHTAHPYPSKNEDDSEVVLTAQLKIPILINPGDMFMRFDEIAYIEYGETGVPWTGEPKSDFYDYVIVEGSKDDGKTWHNFILGWDCRYWKVWEDHFMDHDPPSGFYVNTAVPDESAMRSHLVNLRAAPEFDDNDVILIRFRLYSDPYLSGWGWVVDNLDIGPLIVPIEEYSMIPESVELYPNPTSGMLNLSMQFHEEVDILEISLLDMVGKEILTESYPDPGYSFRQYFDLNELPNGIYLMKLRSGSQSIMKKVILAR